MRSKNNYSPRQKISNNMWHSIYMQVNQRDFQLLMVRSQIDIFFAIIYVLSSQMGHVNSF
jgi:hypothetical protein